MQTLTTELRGARFRPEDAQTVLLSSPAGTPLEFKREPENIHDTNAIMIGIKEGDIVAFVGYVPAEISAWMADEIDHAGQVLSGKILTANGLKPAIELTLAFPEAAAEEEEEETAVDNEDEADDEDES